jgi:hypothetical protein
MESNGVDQERLLGLEAAEQSGLKQRTWAELKLMWRIAFPSILARVTSFGMIVVTQSFIGHVGELQLASYALVQSLILRFSNGILVSHYYMFYFLFFILWKIASSSSRFAYCFFCSLFLRNIIYC